MHSNDSKQTSGLPAISATRRGFTLTELLVVIAIIAMLAALVSVAVVRALDTAKQTAMKTELDQIDSALKAYKEKYGAYPVCDWRGLGGNNRLKQHIAMAFPRYNLADLNADMRTAIIGNGTGTEHQKFRPDMALVFWLSGFGPDPQHPFVSPDGFQINSGTVSAVKVQRTSFMEFDKSRLVPVDSAGAVGVLGAPGSIVASYFPKGVKADNTGAPYIYWDASTYQTLLPDPPTNPRLLFNNTTPPIFANAGVATPYAVDANNNSTVDTNENWANPESFQIICSGGDGKYGNPNAQPTDRARLFPTGVGYDTTVSLADDDNLTNFATNSRLGDAKP